MSDTTLLVTDDKKVTPSDGDHRVSGMNIQLIKTLLSTDIIVLLNIQPCSTNNDYCLILFNLIHNHILGSFNLIFVISFSHQRETCWCMSLFSICIQIGR